MTSVEELTATIRPAAIKPYGGYLRSARKGVLKQAMRGAKSRADERLKRF